MIATNFPKIQFNFQLRENYILIEPKIFGEWPSSEMILRLYFEINGFKNEFQVNTQLVKGEKNHTKVAFRSFPEDLQTKVGKYIIEGEYKWFAILAKSYSLNPLTLGFQYSEVNKPNFFRIIKSIRSFSPQVFYVFFIIALGGVLIVYFSFSSYFEHGDFKRFLGFFKLFVQS